MRAPRRLLAAGFALGALLVGTASAAGSQPPRVVQGSDGWLYIGQDWSVPCQDTTRAGTAGRDAGARWVALGDALADSGRDSVVVLAPDKSTVRSGNVPRSVPQRACADAQKSALRDAVHASPHALDLRRPLSGQAARWQTHWRKDTHWTPTGAAVYAVELSKRFSTLLPYRLGTTERTFSRRGDLADALGRPVRESVRGLQVVNPGVSVRELPRRDVGLSVPVRETRATAAPGALVVPGRTVFVGDSMNDAAVEQLAPLFAEAVFVWVLEADRLAPVVRELRDADRVVVESVERFGPRARLIRPDALEAVRTLPRRTASLPSP